MCAWGFSNESFGIYKGHLLYIVIQWQVNMWLCYNLQYIIEYVHKITIIKHMIAHTIATHTVA